MSIDKVKEFWETCKGNYAHIRPSWEMTPEHKRAKEFHEYFIDDFYFADSTVLEYGCGGGYIGLYMLEHLYIKKYIGVDIAERSIDKAKEVLNDYNAELYLTPVDFSHYKADFFISIACIQHFHNEDYLVDFLDNVNNSMIHYVILQIRYSKNNKFSEINQDTEILNNNELMCRTNSRFISEHLTEYRLKKESKINKKSLGQYLIYER